MDTSATTWEGLNYERIVERLVELARALALQYFAVGFNARNFVMNWIMVPNAYLRMDAPDEVMELGNEGRERVAELLGATLNAHFNNLALLAVAKMDVVRLERLLRPTINLEAVRFYGPEVGGT